MGRGGGGSHVRWSCQGSLAEEVTLRLSPEGRNRARLVKNRRQHTRSPSLICKGCRVELSPPLRRSQTEVKQNPRPL